MPGKYYTTDLYIPALECLINKTFISFETLLNKIIMTKYREYLIIYSLYKVLKTRSMTTKRNTKYQ